MVFKKTKAKTQNFYHGI
ncbi:hypothetical protein Anas_05091 [Armadillidium nasatum]|uniref:Uncharacterized protein n=1 Tax=Armadillidium nasatum TaxID=96803 RepID=A0A5N5SXZ5_9CRUS|nr:hypothetical protein Anas_05091 [Armadillidium nasatum]